MPTFYGLLVAIYTFKEYHSTKQYTNNRTFFWCFFENFADFSEFTGAFQNSLMVLWANFNVKSLFWTRINELSKISHQEVKYFHIIFHFHYIFQYKVNFIYFWNLTKHNKQLLYQVLMQTKLIQFLCDIPCWSYHIATPPPPSGSLKEPGQLVGVNSIQKVNWGNKIKWIL